MYGRVSIMKNNEEQCCILEMISRQMYDMSRVENRESELIPNSDILYI